LALIVARKYVLKSTTFYWFSISAGVEFVKERRLKLSV